MHMCSRDVPEDQGKGIHNRVHTLNAMQLFGIRRMRKAAAVGRGTLTSRTTTSMSLGMRTHKHGTDALCMSSIFVVFFVSFYGYTLFASGNYIRAVRICKRVNCRTCVGLECANTNSIPGHDPMRCNGRYFVNDDGDDDGCVIYESRNVA